MLDGLPDVVPSGAWVVLGVVFSLPILWLAWRTFRGGRYSRLVYALTSLSARERTANEPR